VRVWRPLVKKTTENKRKEHNVEKYIQLLTTLSLTILVYLHWFSSCCVRKLWNPAKFSENSNLYSSRSSKVVDLGLNRKRTCNFLEVIYSNSWRIFHRDIDAFCIKIACFSHPHRYLTPPIGGKPCNINIIYTPLKSKFTGLQYYGRIMCLSSFL